MVNKSTRSKKGPVSARPLSPEFPDPPPPASSAPRTPVHSFTTSWDASPADGEISHINAAYDRFYDEGVVFKNRVVLARQDQVQAAAGKSLMAVLVRPSLQYLFMGLTFLLA